MKAIEINPTIRYNTARIVDVETSASQGCLVTGIKGGHKPERVGSLGQYNGYGGFRVFGKYERVITLKVVVFTENGSHVGYIDIDKDLVLEKYGKQKVTETLMNQFREDVQGKKIKVYWDRELQGLQMYYDEESLWYSNDEMIALDEKHKHKIEEYKKTHPRKPRYFKKSNH